MKVLTIGTDRKLFEENSAVFLRSLEYSKKMNELHVIVLSEKKYGLKEKNIGNLYLYPTNSWSKINYFFDSIRIGKKIIQKNGSNKGDFVISTQDPFEAGLIGYILKRKFNLPLQFQIHTDFLSPYFKNSLLNYFRVYLAKFLIPKADGIRVVGQAIKDSIESTFQNLKTTPVVLPVYVDIEKIMNYGGDARKFAQFESYIFVASRLTREKRIEVALGVFKRVLEKFPKVGLVIAGEGSEKMNLLNKAKELGISNSIMFIGWQNDLLSLYKGAGVFLTTSEYEGYSMTLIEAGASGSPLVTTKVGIAKTDLFKNGENSFVCPVGDVSCLSNAVITLLEDHSKAQLFKQRMQDSIKIEVLSKDEYTQKYVGELQKLVHANN